ncbi:hypothetical protein METHP14_60089 [Pseudomonas sp. P14-2025]
MKRLRKTVGYYTNVAPQFHNNKYKLPP